MKKLVFCLLVFSFSSCHRKTETIKPIVGSISESVYASGILKSKDQYVAYATVNGIVDDIFVTEGDTVKAGAPLLSVSSETQKLNKENAELAERFSDFNTNQGKLNEAKLLVELSKNKMKNDSVLYFRQKALWDQEVGSKIELEQRELAYENSKTSWYSALVKSDDLFRQLNFSSDQSKKNLLIVSKQQNDFTLKSEINGTIFNIFKSKGEIIGPQTPLAVIGDSRIFILEMQVDEYDILKIKIGLPVLVTMDSYKGKVFEASVTKIYPYMTERSKSFRVDAAFNRPPEILYPNITFEANIVLQEKENVLLIPRNYLLNDSVVLSKKGDQLIVKTGLKDYQKVEILSGIDQSVELKKPTE